MTANRRSFFRTIIGIAPAIFVPQLIKPVWKRAKPQYTYIGCVTGKISTPMNNQQWFEYSNLVNEKMFCLRRVVNNRHEWESLLH